MREDYHGQYRCGECHKLEWECPCEDIPKYCKRCASPMNEEGGCADCWSDEE
tara:strand:+ start:557 stop:712 length:156 start_codon:yes stop_codon:yes gene_type:complete